MITTEKRPPSQAERPLVEGDFIFRTEDFNRIAAMLHADAGIFLPETKATLVYSRLAKRLRSLGLQSFRDYCELVAGQDGLEERQKMLVSLTTNVTSFFREPHHFDMLRTSVLPPLLAAAKAGKRVRLWSAACSKGHEPYSMAMTILALMPDAADHDIRILATDIDTEVLAEGQAGRYDESLVQSVPPAERRKGFLPMSSDGRILTVTPDMRRLVSFRELNLIGQWPMKGKFDVIFCRNVVIYFDDDTQAKVWSRFATMMVPGGTLFIGHSERVQGPASNLFTTAGTTAYRFRGGKP
ncbi:protein-glutamate O-methyltransferase [Lichenihabitans sp. Uapishka_5]|uniref:CheR family methyltransferase n=1 Tax=Lichenihabitans sp. Uapishka_5 TaxID=3037302 RepID=UPI0029E80356|nr:protein-glutamate O-methyltransferase [Lichenihabitans sp. Uapishka_5]MDX7951098.1 protein-glutamate O-methyltransferase [Lichenihabitans sp. Uapishka_5]